MGQARLGDDGRYHGDLPCQWCGALIDQGGRRRVRRYCGGWHRTRLYVTRVVVVITGAF
ncbi:hypothetical protein [Streptomyces sp. MMG1533]|uniref:hypothetical protein n=1 Tax=Streptomyces sp. MMG1533 TaxID=1415546 RepID=UPI000A6EA5EA|nr:hypothetical protein [Streptomyces sp. MMG1533]